MEWLNLETRVLHSPEYIGSDPTERAAWLNVSMWCAQQENGGRIVGARTWKDRQWQQTCGVTAREVARATRLIVWDGDDAVVWNYPQDKEMEVQAKRKAGRDTAAKRWGKLHSSPDSSATSSPDAERKGIGKGIGKEVEVEGEGAEGDSPQPALAGIDAPPPAPILTFPTAGRTDTWDLHQPLVDELTRAFPNVAVLAECDKAKGKIETGAVPKKTARGMPRFLWTWMERSQNSARPAAKTNGTYQPNSRSFEQRQSYADLGI